MNPVIGSDNVALEELLRNKIIEILNEKKVGVEAADEILQPFDDAPSIERKETIFEEILENVEISIPEIRKIKERIKIDKLREDYNTPILMITNFKDNVREFSKKQPFFFDKAQSFWLWIPSDFKYQRVDDTDILNSIQRTLRLSGEIITNQTKNNYLEALRQVGREKEPKAAKKTWVQFRDSYVDIDTNNMYSISPDYFFTNPLPYKTGESFETPTIDRIFKDWVGIEFRPTLYEIIAYCMLPDYPIHRIFCLIGSGMNGKSKYFQLLGKFIGQENLCSTELDTLLSSRFEVTKLHKKLVCVMGETDFTTMKKTSMIKKLTGQDLIGFEYKHKTPFQDHNYAKILIATNSLPITDDKSVGFYRRWLLIDFPNEFTEKKDILKDIPEHEYNNLSHKCCRVLFDLLNKKEFTHEGSLEERRKRYENKSNHVINFVKEKCIQDYDSSIIFSEFYSKFCIWCKENKQRPLGASKVGSLLREAGLDVSHKSISVREDDDTINRTTKTTTQRNIFGLKFKEEIQRELKI